MPLAVTGALDRDFTAAAPNQYRQTGEVIRASLNAFAQGQNVNLGGMLECLLVGMHTNHDYESESSQLALGLQSPQRHFTFVDARYSNDEPPADHLDDDLGVSSNEVFDRFVNVANGVGIDANLQAVYDFGAEDHMRSCHIREV